MAAGTLGRLVQVSLTWVLHSWQPIYGRLPSSHKATVTLLTFCGMFTSYKIRSEEQICKAAVLTGAQRSQETRKQTALSLQCKCEGLNSVLVPYKQLA